MKLFIGIITDANLFEEPASSQTSVVMSYFQLFYWSNIIGLELQNTHTQLINYQYH